MNKEQERAWKKAEKAASAERKQLLEKTRDEVVALLTLAKNNMVLVLASAPTDYQQWQMTALQREIDRVLAELTQSSTRKISDAVMKAWEGGISAIDKPLAAAGFRVIMPHLDTGQLMAMRAFTVDRISDISVVAGSKIKQQIGLAMIGSQSIHDTITNVATHLDDTSRSRATTIVRDSLSAAWSTASDDRAQQSEEAGVAMDKIWRRSGKIHSRLAHDLADGRRVAADQPFIINGHKIRYPHDPKAPISEIINCGCIALYRPRETPGTLPDKRPFTADELALNPNKQQLQSGKSVAELLKGK
ncbi:MAG: hypothetical protein D3M94_07170 [Rhodocyclales bacterium GT-UBC]|nr:MAG: hypothetical protein D3M94_07170 [Rhodocyclales bacterium GT-UBC]